jgi:diadenosine tetraphosphate (Ap4A) HIT family hydrolase
VGDLRLSRALLMNDASYAWVVLVPRRPGATEIVDLSATDRADLMDEISLVSHTLRGVVACDKLNVASLGNVVPQLHVHVIARRKDDPAWPKPVWGAVPAQPYAVADAGRLVAALREGLQIR